MSVTGDSIRAGAAALILLTCLGGAGRRRGAGDRARNRKAGRSARRDSPRSGAGGSRR